METIIVSLRFLRASPPIRPSARPPVRGGLAQHAAGLWAGLGVVHHQQHGLGALRRLRAGGDAEFGEARLKPRWQMRRVASLSLLLVLRPRLDSQTGCNRKRTRPAEGGWQVAGGVRAKGATPWKLKTQSSKGEPSDSNVPTFGFGVGISVGICVCGFLGGPVWHFFEERRPGGRRPGDDRGHAPRSGPMGCVSLSQRVALPPIHMEPHVRDPAL